MNLLQKLREERKLPLLILLLLCGAALLVASVYFTPQEVAQHKQEQGNSVEARLSYVLSRIDGAGQVDVLVMEEEAEILGVIVVAQGADDLTVRTELMRAAMTALDVEAEHVEVFARMEE